jgi:regulator of sigma E protease
MELVQSLITIVLFFAILGVLVVIHEIGHFITARLAGVRVLEFGVGFPPRAKVLRAEGETLYTLNWLPIGGFVKLEGEDGDDTDDPRSFANARLPTKLVILVAGVVMNIVLSFAIFAGIAFFGDPTFGVRVGGVQDGSPAATAGIRPGDVIASLDGRYFDVLKGETLLPALQARAGQTVTLGLERADGTTEQVQVTLRDPSTIQPNEGALGVEALTAATTKVSVSHPPLQAIELGVERTTGALGLILNGLRDLGDAIINRPSRHPRPARSASRPRSATCSGSSGRS